jgi:hypothetical protein
MTDITKTLVGFPALQVQALKGTFIEQAGDNTFSGTNTFTGTNTFSSTLTATGTTQINTLKVGASGTVGAFNAFPATAARGSLRILAANSTGDTVTTITNAAQSGAATYTIPDATTSDFVMTAGTQTIGGAKTFSAAGVFSSTLATTGVLTPTGGVAAAGGFTAAPRGLASQGQPAVTTADGNNSTPSTTETYITSMFVPCNMTITGVKVFNGTDVTGNIRIGLANAVTGAPIAAALTASTAGSGTDAYQTIPFAAPYAAVGPANYLVCVQYDSATARYNTHTLGTDPCIVQTATTYGTIPTISPLPTVFVTNVGNIMSFY